jgi:hypothetical protein
MRWFDEKQCFNEGDEVIVEDNPELGIGTISAVNTHSVYYEARPIASYTAYRYYVDFKSEKKSYAASELSLYEG